MARAMRRWTRNDSGTDRPESFLEVWNVAAARERAARFDGDAAWLSDLDAVVFDLAPDLESEAREAIAAANTAFRANDDRVAILTLDPGYQRSLTQYHFAQQLLGKVSLLVAVATLVMMVFVIKLMTTSTLERRLSQYSLFATFGLSRADMIAMILVQVSLSALVGIAIATLCFPRLVRAANAALDESGLTVDLYRELGFAFPEGLVLDLDRGLYVFAGVTVFVVFTGLAALSAWLLGILGARYPSQYVQRKGDRRQAPVAGEA
jgi:ABC-type antimicrobial peptide transport system permease subunit